MTVTPPVTPETSQQLSSPLLRPYLRLQIFHGDPADDADAEQTRTRLDRVRFTVGPWWLRSIATHDCLTLHLAIDADVDHVVRALAEHVPITWPVTLTRIDGAVQ